MLSTSQPSISEHIKNLEKGLGCRLFDRLGRSIRPTKKAQILYPKALAIIKDIETLEEELAVEEQNISGELIVGASTIPGAYLLPRFANSFRQLHTNISFEIRISDSGEIIDSVLNHDLCLGFVGNKFQSKNLQFDPFIEDELVLAAAPERKIDNDISLKDVIHIPFLMRENGSGTRKTIEEHFTRNGLDINRFNIVAVLGSNTAIKEGLKENLGISIVSRISIRDELESGSIREIQIKAMPIKRKFYAVTLKKKTLPIQYTVFLQLLLHSQRDGLAVT